MCDSYLWQTSFVPWGTKCFEASTAALNPDPCPFAILSGLIHFDVSVATERVSRPSLMILPTGTLLRILLKDIAEWLGA